MYSEHGDHKIDQSKNKLSYKLALSLAALGVVYGDIGTSPLYALKESFQHSHIPVNEANVLGILSMVVWSLILVISMKYVFFVLKADYKGEGGILALSSLLQDTQLKSRRLKIGLTLLGVFGAAFLYGDGIITPAISILGAVEGLQIVTPVFEPYVIPITLIIMIGLFTIQKKGTGSVGKIFGPVMLLWFLTIGALGIYSAAQSPLVFGAVNPIHAITFFLEHSTSAFIVLGSVVLVVTGGEALYSDLGHFGLEPIKWAWFFIVLPCLLMNYFGQGAFLLRDPLGVINPFYMMAPKWSLIPLVILASLAATIASQALISGVFSITMQAVQQGYMPRFLIQHTSEKEFGQIYIKNINRFLMVGSILLVLMFKTSSNLAGAYGIAVTATMLITTILFYYVAVYRWHWNRLFTKTICILFGLIDLAFFGSNTLKMFDGGWLPIMIGVGGFIYMTTWKTGRRILGHRLKEKIIPLDDFFEQVDKDNHVKVDGMAIYMNRNLAMTPYSLVHSYEHFKSIHKNIMFMTVVTDMIPRIDDDTKRFELAKPNDRYYQLTVHYGFLEKPDIPKVLDCLKKDYPQFDPMKVTYILSRENIYATENPGMALWREKLFAIQAKNEMPATEYFNLPRSRVVEIGAQVAL